MGLSEKNKTGTIDNQYPFQFNLAWEALKEVK
jgi:hypothetical protein